MKDNGGPAFPADKIKIYSTGLETHRLIPGMSLRDWFAGQALIFGIQKWGEYNASYVATEAYEIADAMIAERGKK